MRRFLVALALAVTLPLPVMAGQVTVKEGETLSEIAERHGISLSRLMQINGIRSADLVEAGRTLSIPGSGGGRSQQTGRSSAGTVTVQPGETLSEIAERHGISLSRLMQINGIRNAALVEAGRTLSIPGSGGGRSQQTGRSSAGTVTVQPGETLSEIAERHGTSLSRLIQINGIRNADQVEAGQILRLQRPTTATARSAGTPVPSAPSFPRGAREHVVRSGESLSVIASGYGIALSRLMAINGISDPDHVEAGTRLKLKGTPPAAAPSPRPAAAPSPRPAVTTAAVRPTAVRPASASAGSARPAVPAATPAPRPAAPAAQQAAAVSTTAPSVATAPAVAMASPDWRTYGPMQVNWAAWQPMGGSMVAPLLNAKGETLYMAINCGARKVNSTTPAGAWQNWNDPNGADEQQLVSDYCRTRS